MENTSGIGEGMTLRLRSVLVVLSMGWMVLTDTPSAEADELTGTVAPYLQARDDHAVGDVVGRAYRDPTRPTLPPIPLDGVSVMLLPYSPGVESELDEIKEHLRDSLKHYMSAASDIDSVRTAYESDLVWVGGGELVRGDVSNAQGLVRLTGVPAGEWVLLAWREETRPSKAPKLRAQETKGFRDIPVSVGHSIVTYWSKRIAVRAGETTSVDLNDRNVWIAAVQEHFQMVQGSSNPPTRRRR